MRRAGMSLNVIAGAMEATSSILGRLMTLAAREKEKRGTAWPAPPR